VNELIYDRIKENLGSLKMSNTLQTIDNYLEHAIKENLPVLDVLDHILMGEAAFRNTKSINMRVNMAGFPFKKTLDDFDFEFQPSINKDQMMELATMRFVHNQENVVFLGPPGVGKTHLAVALGMLSASNRFSTYYINCHQLVENLNKAHYENRLAERIKHYAKYAVLIIDEIGYLPLDIQGANLFFQLIAKRYEKKTTIFTSNKPFSKWNEVFADTTIAAAILDRVLHHCTVINIKGESYRLKERKEHMKKQGSVNTLFDKQ
jgi:DNA replication protein DnaC